MSLRWMLGLVGLWLMLATGCQDNNTVVVPNRVLDRPLDVALACVNEENGAVAALSFNACGDDVTTCTDTEAPQLIGFVANSEKNEIAMFRQCDQNGLVDLDRDAPGFQFFPAGILPSRIVRTNDSCRVISANTGSCDMTVVDLPGAAAYALDLQPPGAPSSLTSTLVPRLSNGEPLGSRPGDIIAVPNRLSQAGGEDNLGGDDGDTGDGGGTTTGGGGADTGGADTGDPGFAASTCTPETPASVYVTFPSCQLIAEVSVLSQRILQSRQFVRDDGGTPADTSDDTIEIVDSGSDPLCPIDCPAQFPGGLPDRELADPDGMFPMTLALVERFIDRGSVDPDEQLARDVDEASLLYDTLFVGGIGLDTIYELPIDTARRQWPDSDQTLSLTLDQPGGVHSIRVTPPAPIPPEGLNQQFLYVIAGDGATHVVRRDLEEASVGIECDAQVDPNAAGVTDTTCHPINPGSVNTSPARRARARGPGIRAPFSSLGAVFTDWAFQRVLSEDTGDTSRVPFGSAGIVGVGATSFGRIAFSTIGQFQDAGRNNLNFDPVGIMDVEIRPHSTWPALNPFGIDPTPLPTVADIEPSRIIPGEDLESRVLSPTLRRIDLAYATVSEAEDPQNLIASTLGTDAGPIRNVDQLGSFEEEGIYTTQVPRVVARDYREWDSPRSWGMVWEGTLPGTFSRTGRLQCDRLGWEGGTCLNDEPDDARLVDESAEFCEQGVLPGDKLVVIGCLEDEACGPGQRCLREPTAVASARGVCVSERLFNTQLEQLLQVCAPFISDPCGSPRIEYLVTRAFQSEVWLQALDIPPTAWVREETDDTGQVRLVEREARLSCAVPEGLTQPEAGCDVDEDCEELGDTYVCIDSVCRTPCDGGTPECLEVPLAGNRCFAELVDYEIRARNQLLVLRGTNLSGFLSDRVIADPDTGECRIDPQVSNLLTSRIRLGADEDETFNDPINGIPACANASEADPADANPCRIVRSRSQSADTLFHTFDYFGEEVSAIRYSNPWLSLVIDLSSLLDLALEPPDFPGRVWPTSFRRFRRSRLVRGYQEAFDANQGLIELNEPLIVGNTQLVYPSRILMLPEPSTIAFVVDSGGRGGTTGVRGQVVRVELFPQVLADQNFRVR